MATLYEYQTVRDSGWGTGYWGVDHWAAQSFTVGTIGDNENFDITTVKIMGKRVGNDRTLNLYLYASSGDEPTGEVLSSGSIGTDNWATDAYSWQSVSMSSYTLIASTKYVVVMKITNSGNSDFLYFGVNGDPGSYTGGIFLETQDGGDTWDIKTDDACFEIWGEAAAVGTNMKINIADAWKDVDSMKINIGDVWKDVAEVKQNIGDAWKVVF